MEFFLFFIQQNKRKRLFLQHSPKIGDERFELTGEGQFRLAIVVALRAELLNESIDDRTEILVLLFQLIEKLIELTGKRADQGVNRSGQRVEQIGKCRRVHDEFLKKIIEKMLQERTFLHRQTFFRFLQQFQR